MKNLHNATAIILAGGLGTRLRSAVSDRPKVLAEIHGRPFLTYLFDQLTAAGLRAAVLCTGYCAGQVQAILGDAYGELDLRYSPEPTPLGTGGALRLALPLMGEGPILVLNGDSYFDVDLPALWQAHSHTGARATIALARVADTQRFGRVLLADDGQLTAFEEKGAHAGPGWINAGVYVLHVDWAAAIAAGRAVSLERECFPAWIGRGLYGHRQEGRFLDIGTPESYAAASAFFAAPAAREKAAGEDVRKQPFTGTVPLVRDRLRPISPRRFVVLDRDGTIIVERHHLTDPEAVELIPGVAAGLRRLHALGLGLAVVTNQSVIGRGLLDEAVLAKIHARMADLLAAEGVTLDAVYFCPHAPDDGCACRKPLPGLLQQAAREWAFDPGRCFVIGDKPCDIELGQQCGATTFLARTGYGEQVAASGAVAADYVVADVAAAAEIIARLLAAEGADDRATMPLHMAEKN